MGRQLDRYRLVRHVGRGGSSDVFEAEHIHVGKRVALKLLRRELARDEHAVERLRREARTASAIGHRNIVNVEDFGVTADGTVYLAMEWLDGETLAQRIERGPVGLPRDGRSRRCRSAPAWAPPTPPASCTATSSRPTSSSSTRTARPGQAARLRHRQVGAAAMRG